MLEQWKEAKARGGIYSVVVEGQASGKEGEKGPKSGESSPEERVVREEDVHRLCARLGMGISREEVSIAFRVSTLPIPFPRWILFLT